MLRFMWTFPHNDHPLPIAESWDGDRWTVDLSYRVTRWEIDIETTAAHSLLATARLNAFSNLKRILNTP